MRNKTQIADAVARWQLASLEAVASAPALIVSFGRASQQSIFTRFLETYGNDVGKLYIVAKCSGRATYFAQLVEHAIAHSKTDALWSSIVRLALRWSDRGHAPDWDDEAIVGSSLNKLVARVSPSMIEEIMVMINPSLNLWFAKMVDFDSLWRNAIRQDLDNGNWDESYNKLVIAGLGMSEISPSALADELHIDQEHLRQIHEAKQFCGDDEFAWRVYGRSNSFDELVEMAYDSHVKGGILDPSRQPRSFSKAPRFYVNHTNGCSRGMFTSLYGLLSRDARRTWRLNVEFEGVKRSRPTQTVPGEMGTKLWQLMLCHKDRALNGVRKTVNVRSVIQA